MQELRPIPNDTNDADAIVRRLYDAPGPLLRWNMVSTLDGSGVGSDGRSGSINTAADHRVFEFLRGWADAVIVGARTVRTEGYPPLEPNRWSSLLREDRSPAPLLAVLSRSPELPPTLGGAREDQVRMFAGPDVTPTQVVQTLHGLGRTRLLLEGGPSLAREFVAAGLVDELCLTVVPELVAGEGTRILRGAGVEVAARLESLLEDDGTLLTRWAL